METGELIRVDSWEELVAVLDDLRDWVFRGQCSARWELQTSLERYAPPNQARFITEMDWVREFRRRAHNYLGPHEMPSTTGEWLALMQHHGAPTRLLDVTRSPYVAAYFGFEDSPPDGCADCAIWAIDARLCARRSGAEALKDLAWLVPQVEDTFRATNGVVDRETIAAMHLTRALWEADRTIGILNPAVLTYQPHKLSDRMSVQQGLFVLPGNIELSFMQNLNGVDAAAAVKKIVVSSAAVRGRALDQLRLMNITRASLFRGLDGFAQSFRQLLVRETQQQREQRLVDQALRPRRRDVTNPSDPESQC